MNSRIFPTIALVALLLPFVACDDASFAGTDTDDGAIAVTDTGDAAGTDTDAAVELDAIAEIEAEADPSTIIGGNTASEGEYPFMSQVRIMTPYGPRYCGATLVAPSRVLTSADCLVDSSRPGGIALASDVTVGIGYTGFGFYGSGEVRSVSQVVLHPKFNPSLPIHQNHYALAVLVLSTPSTVEPVEIASPYGPSDRANWLAGATATTLGWGDTLPNGYSSSYLQEMQIPVLSDSSPDAQYLAGTFVPGIHVMAGAAAPGGASEGDEGGPLLVPSATGWKQIGVHLYTTHGQWTSSPSLYSRIGAPELYRWLKTAIHETPAVGDVNGDGKDDIVTFTHGDSSSGPLDVYVALSNGTTFGTAQKWQDWWAHRGHDAMLGDFDGDGRADIWAFTDKDVWVSRSRGYDFNGGVYSSPVGTLTVESIGRVGDVNGDGRADAVVFANDGSGDVHVMLATVSGFGPKTKWHDVFSYPGESPRVADVNGDGRADIVNFTQSMDGKQVRVALSNGSSFGARTTWHSNFGSVGEVPEVGDFDGDGKDDVLRFIGNGLVYVGQSNGASFTQTLRDLDFGDRSDALLAGDVNGDGKDDIIRFTQDHGADVYVALSTGTLFDPAYLAHGYFSP